MKKHLLECNTFNEQKQLCLDQLMSGKTLHDYAIWLGGADPDMIVESLRSDGVLLKSCYIPRFDASDTRRKVLAWRIER